MSTDCQITKIGSKAATLFHHAGLRPAFSSNMARRHSDRLFVRYGKRKDRKNDPSYFIIRGREQQLIEFYRAQGRSGNAINGIYSTGYF